MTRTTDGSGRRVRRGAAAMVVAGVCAACGGSPPPADPGAATPVYNPDTGKLEQITSDRNHDGKVDTRAFMDGTRIVRIEIDRNGDGRVDRWEYYIPAPAGTPASVSPDGRNMIDRADEANGSTDTPTRHEIYDHGVIAKVDEDTDGDGRPDKWEVYRAGVLAQVLLDLQGKGFPDRRLTYGGDGNVERIEADPDGDGVFGPVPPERPAASAPARGGGSRP